MIKINFLAYETILFIYLLIYLFTCLLFLFHVFNRTVKKRQRGALLFERNRGACNLVPSVSYLHASLEREGGGGGGEGVGLGWHSGEFQSLRVPG